jgi:integrase
MGRRLGDDDVRRRSMSLGHHSGKVVTRVFNAAAGGANNLTTPCSLVAVQGCIEIVSKLLGHSSIKVTDRHYSPWVKARQDQLEAEVRRMWTSTDSSL